MKITLYTTDCPKCKILESKLNSKNIKYDICHDINVMLEKGFMNSPMLDVDGQIMDYTKATNWINGGDMI